MLSACPACQGSTPALNKITWSWMSAIPAHRCRRIRIKIVLYCIVNPDQSGLGEIPFQTATEAEPRLFPSPLAPSPDQDFPLSTVTASPLPASSRACLPVPFSKQREVKVGGAQEVQFGAHLLSLQEVQGPSSAPQIGQKG